MIQSEGDVACISKVATREPGDGVDEFHRAEQGMHDDLDTFRVRWVVLAEAAENSERRGGYALERDPER